MAKGDTFSLNPYINNYFEEKEMQKIPDVSAVGSRIYAQVCIQSILRTLLECWVDI